VLGASEWCVSASLPLAHVDGSVVGGMLRSVWESCVVLYVLDAGSCAHTWFVDQTMPRYRTDSHAPVVGQPNPPPPPVSLPCVIALCYPPPPPPTVSPPCGTTLWHHPVSPPCIACLLRLWQEVFGVGLGSMGDLTVTVELRGPRGLTFPTPMCDVLEDMVHLKCVSPQGVGRVLSVVVVVGGVRSEPLATPALTYTTPIVLEITGPGSSDAPTMVCAHRCVFRPIPIPIHPTDSLAHTQPYTLTPCPSPGSVCVFLLVVATPSHPLALQHHPTPPPTPLACKPSPSVRASTSSSGARTLVPGP
jgi:hypothetical protein